MEPSIPKEALDLLSFRSALGQSLKQISLRETPLELILGDIAKYRSSCSAGGTTRSISGVTAMSINIKHRTQADVFIRNTLTEKFKPSRIF